jgi:integration host factor subunit beta
MTKSDLINAIREKVQVNRKDAEKIVETFFKSIEASLLTGERVEIRGFGSFAVRDYQSYTGRNPKTGEKISVSRKKLPFFKAGKALKEMVDVT